MRVLGIDPGATTGWCVYDTEIRSVLDSGHFAGHAVPPVVLHMPVDAVVIERPVGYGPTRPELVQCGYVCGRIVEAFALVHAAVELTRREVCATLTDAVHGCIRVKNDATAWAALVELHGGVGKADAKSKKRRGVVVEAGGPLGGVTSHQRAALAVAVAWVLRQAVTK